MKERVRSLEEEKLHLQSELERLNSMIQRQLVISNSVVACPGGGETSTNKSNNDSLQSLEMRTTSEYSDDGVSVN